MLGKSCWIRHCTQNRMLTALSSFSFHKLSQEKELQFLHQFQCFVATHSLPTVVTHCSQQLPQFYVHKKMLSHLRNFECFYNMHQPHGPSSVLPRAAAPVPTSYSVIEAPLLSALFCCSISSTTVTPQHAPQNSCPSSSPLMKWSSSASGMREPTRTAREKASSSLLSSQMPSACGTTLGPRAQLRVKDSSQATERLTLPQVHRHHHCFCSMFGRLVAPTHVLGLLSISRCGQGLQSFQ